MTKQINLENMAAHLQAMGYKATAKSFTRNSGEIADIVEFSGLGHVNAFYEQHVDPAQSGLKVFGNLPKGYAPALIGEDGKAIRERVSVAGGPLEWRTKRGEPLDDEALKRKNNEIALKVRQQITGPTVAAYLIEANGGDLQATADAFRLKKYERKGKTADATDDADGAEYGESAEADIPADSHLGRMVNTQAPSL